MLTAEQEIRMEEVSMANYVKARDGLITLAQELQSTTHAQHPHPALTDAITKFNGVIHGCSVRIRRLQAIGR